MGSRSSGALQTDLYIQLLVKTPLCLSHAVNIPQESSSKDLFYGMQFQGPEACYPAYCSSKAIDIA